MSDIEFIVIERGKIYSFNTLGAEYVEYKLDTLISGTLVKYV